MHILYRKLFSVISLLQLSVKDYEEASDQSVRLCTVSERVQWLLTYAVYTVCFIESHVH